MVYDPAGQPHSCTSCLEHRPCSLRRHRSQADQGSCFIAEHCSSSEVYKRTTIRKRRFWLAGLKPGKSEREFFKSGRHEDSKLRLSSLSACPSGSKPGSTTRGSRPYSHVDCCSIKRTDQAPLSANCASTSPSANLGSSKIPPRTCIYLASGNLDNYSRFATGIHLVRIQLCKAQC